MENQETRCISLAGEWEFALDPEKIGMEKQYFNRSLGDTILLPGTTDENGKGDLCSERETERLTRVYSFSGFAWYQRKIVIREDWRGKQVSLFLERTRISHVWVDAIYFGRQDSICAPHLYELGTSLTPGIHTLTVLVDHSGLPISGGHQTSPDTQTNWNGILGRMELEAREPVRLEDVQAYPDVNKMSVLLKLCIKNGCGEELSGRLTLSASAVCGNEEVSAQAASYSVKLDESGMTGLSVEYLLGPGFPLWDEVSPTACKLTVLLEVNNGTYVYEDKKEIPFGMREFAVCGTQFSINGRTVFLRGKHDACVFPLTGYAPMDAESWTGVFKIAKAYGINHYRFHTCCPPEACFIAADREGICLEVELPYWEPYRDPDDADYDAEKAAYIGKEARRILRTYGNHPSFVLFSLGNELGGSRKAMSALIGELKREDGRHLYAEGSNSFFWDPSLSEAADFWVTMRTAQGDAMVRGSFSHADKPLGHIQAGPPSTVKEYSGSIAGVPVPVVGHEIGQYQSFPNFEEIEKYTGVLKPYHFEIFRERLRSAGMLDQADDFFKASGKLAVLCYKEEIEAALRTPGFGGIQLLDLQDFPGQGTALVGILDAFMDSKGFITPEEWREFCSDTVLLACFDRYTYYAEEEFGAEIKMAHYGAGDLEQVMVEWLLSGKNMVYGQGVLSLGKVEQGGVASAGSVRIGLAGACAPEKLTFELKLRGTDIKNRYSIWVYPANVEQTVPESLRICRRMGEAEKYLDMGGKVLLVPDWMDAGFVSKGIGSRSVEGFFAPDFWCYPMFRSICENAGKETAPGTLGLLCDCGHKALSEFPSDFHSDWQWWHIVMNSRSFILDGAPEALRPIVQVIDNFERNHRLGLLFEARCGAGKLLVCGSDLLAHPDKPEMKQLLHSLLRYMDSDDFDPQQALELPS
jgi:hypothetical protein